MVTESLWSEVRGASILKERGSNIVLEWPSANNEVVLEKKKNLFEQGQLGSLKECGVTRLDISQQLSERSGKSLNSSDIPAKERRCIRMGPGRRALCFPRIPQHPGSGRREDRGITQGLA